MKFLGQIYYRIPASRWPYLYPFLYTLGFISLAIVLALQNSVFYPYPKLDELYSIRGTLKQVISKRRGISIVVADDFSEKEYRFPGRGNHMNVYASERRLFEKSVGHPISVKWAEEAFPFSLLGHRKDIWDLNLRGYKYRDYDKKMQGSRENYWATAATFYMGLIAFLFCLLGPLVLYRREALLKLQDGNHD